MAMTTGQPTAAERPADRLDHDGSFVAARWAS
jgi:hypothetical protein